MPRLLLIRHGETDLNAQGRFQGHSDPPLNDRGRRQAELIAQELRDEKFDAVFSSDLLRAQETAEIVVRNRDVPIRRTNELRELSFGVWEELTYGEIQQKYPEEYRRWQTDPAFNPPPGGESLVEIGHRLSLFFDPLRERGDQETILIATHGGPIRLMVCRAFGLPASDYRRIIVGPGSLSEIWWYSGVFTLACLNCTAAKSDG